jgi:hypothetical protein
MRGDIVEFVSARLAALLVAFVLVATPLAGAVCEMTCAPAHAVSETSCHLTTPDASEAIGAFDPCSAAAALAGVLTPSRSPARDAAAIAGARALEVTGILPADCHATVAPPSRPPDPPSAGFVQPLRI